MRLKLVGLAAAAALASAVPSAPALAQLPALQDRPLSGAERTRLASLEVQFTRISAQRNTSVAALRTIARAMGARLTTQDPDQILKAVEDRAGELAKSRERIATLERDLESMDSMKLAQAVGPLLTDARAAIDEGRLEDAEAKLGQAGERFAQARGNLQGRVDQLAEREAEIYAERAEVRRSVFDDGGAAALYGQAAALIPASNAAVRTRYRLGQAAALIAMAGDGADLEAGKRAVTLLREEVLPASPRETRPEDWAKAQSLLGAALLRLGERQQDPALLKESIEAMKLAVAATPPDQLAEVVRRERSLASALSYYGTNQNSRAILEEAAGVLRKTAARNGPEQWETERSLGVVLGRIANLPNGGSDTTEAVAMVRRAISHMPPDISARTKADALMNVGALLMIGNSNHESLAAWQAVADAADAANAAITREQAPFLWASIQRLRGRAQTEIGEEKGKAGGPNFAEAIRLLLAAEEVLTLEQAPSQWAALKQTQGEAYYMKGKWTDSVPDLQKSIAAFEASCTFVKDRIPLWWGQNKAFIALDNAHIALLSTGSARKAAVEAARSAAAESEPILKQAEDTDSLLTLTEAKELLAKAEAAA